MSMQHSREPFSFRAVAGKEKGERRGETETQIFATNLNRAPPQELHVQCLIQVDSAIDKLAKCYPL